MSTSWRVTLPPSNLMEKRENQASFIADYLYLRVFFRKYRWNFTILFIFLSIFSSIALAYHFGLFVERKPLSSHLLKIEGSFYGIGRSPRGLTWDGEYLWVSFPDKRAICQIDPSNGRIVQTFHNVVQMPWGLAWDGEHLWVSDVYTARLYEVDPKTGSIVSSLTVGGLIYPTGLAYDGKYLWVSDSHYSKIMKINITAGKILSSIPKRSITGMAWEANGQGYLWISVTENLQIQKIDSTTGKIIKICYSPSSSPAGLAWDGDHLWIGDIGNGKIYETSPYAQQYAEYGKKLPSYFWLLFLLTLFPVFLTFLSNKEE